MTKSAPPQQSIYDDKQFKSIAHAAETDKSTEIQERVSKETLSLLRRYGARAAMSGAAVQAPLQMGA
jgi:hypothetical protein